MARPVLPPAPPHTVTARLADGRLLIARLNPALGHQNSPLQRALHAAGLLPQ